MRADSGAWEYEMSSIRVVVKIPLGTYPELVADLDRVAPRERAERLRLLAMIGLRDLNLIEPRMPKSHDAPSSPTTKQNSNAAGRDTANNIIRKLTKGL